MKYVISIITVFQIYQICMSLFTFKNVNKLFILQGYRPQILFVISLPIMKYVMSIITVFQVYA